MTATDELGLILEVGRFQALVSDLRRGIAAKDAEIARLTARLAEVVEACLRHAAEAYSEACRDGCDVDSAHRIAMDCIRARTP